jgi:hypothetical protein
MFLSDFSDHSQQADIEVGVVGVGGTSRSAGAFSGAFACSGVETVKGEVDDPHTNIGRDKYLHSRLEDWQAGVAMVRASCVAESADEPAGWYVCLAKGRGYQFEPGDMIMLKNLPPSPGCGVDANAAWYTCERSAGDYVRCADTGVEYHARHGYDWKAARYLWAPKGGIPAGELAANERLLAQRREAWGTNRTAQRLIEAEECRVFAEVQAELRVKSECSRAEEAKVARLAEERLEAERASAERAERSLSEFREDWEVGSDSSQVAGADGSTVDSAGVQCSTLCAVS